MSSFISIKFIIARLSTVKSERNKNWKVINRLTNTHHETKSDHSLLFATSTHNYSAFWFAIKWETLHVTYKSDSPRNVASQLKTSERENQHKTVGLKSAREHDEEKRRVKRWDVYAVIAQFPSDVIYFYLISYSA